MLLTKVECESVTPRKDFITDMAFIFRHPSNLMDSLEVMAHGLECVTRIITTLHCAVIHTALVVNLCVFLEITLVLKSFVTEVTRVRTLITVTESDVDLQSCQSGAGHVTEGTFDLIHMLTNVIPQKSLTGKGFATMFTYQRLYGLGLPVKVVKQFSVAGEQAATCRTGDESLLSVAPHVFSQTVLDLKEGIAACPVAEERLLLLCKSLWLSTFYVIVHMSVEPLRIIKCAITVLPLANVSIRSFWKQVAAVQALVAARQVRTGLEQL